MRIFSTVIFFVLAVYLCDAALVHAQGERKNDQNIESGQKQNRQSRRGRKQRPNAQPNVLQNIRRLDRNKDGLIAKSEVPARMWKRLAEMDADDNQMIDTRELKVIAKRLQQSQRRGRGTDGRKSAPQSDQQNKGRKQMNQQGPQTPNNNARRTNFAQAVKRMDTNRDGSLSRDEAPQRLRQRFDQVDQDDNGMLDQQEIKRLIARMQMGQAGNSVRRGEQDKGGIGGVKPKRPPRGDGQS